MCACGALAREVGAEADQSVTQVVTRPVTDGRRAAASETDSSTTDAMDRLCDCSDCSDCCPDPGGPTEWDTTTEDHGVKRRFPDASP
jgi:hypothetical protein